MVHGITIKEEIGKFLNFDYKNFLKRRAPITEWLPRYQTETLLHDLLAGLTVSITEIPQSMAYANIAGLPPQYGLYSCITGGLVYAVFGTCKDINIGPTSIMSLMTAPYVEKFGPEVAVLLSFLCGSITLLLALCNLGFVIDFFSYPVAAGFTCAAALEVASTQINNFFGIRAKAVDFLNAWIELPRNFDKINPWDAALGATSLVVLLFLREIRRFEFLKQGTGLSKTRRILSIAIPFVSLSSNVIVISLGTILAYVYKENCPFLLTGEVKGGFPPLETPSIDKVTTYTHIVTSSGVSILFLPLIAILELISAAKTFKQGQSLDATQELVTLGLSNFFGYFVSSMPVSASFSRSAINNASGVQTPFGGIFTTLVILLAMAFLTPIFYFVPKASLAAVIICAMIYLFEYRAFLTFWRSKKIDMIPFLATFVCCLIISIPLGIVIGLCINITFIMYPSARPKISQVQIQVPKYGGDVYIVKPLDNLHFPSAGHVENRVLGLEGTNILVVFDGEYLRNIDLTVARGIVALNREMRKNGKRIIFWHFKEWIIFMCLSIDNSMKESFKFGELEDIIQDSAV